MLYIRPYHILRRGIKKNPHALRLAQVAEPLYADSRFRQFCGNITDERLSICTLLNWARTIADSIESDPMPLERLGFFERQLGGSRPGLFEILLYPFNIQDLKAHECATIWGAAYFWLKEVAQTKQLRVLQRIKEIGMREPTCSPYFAVFFTAAHASDRQKPAKERKARPQPEEESLSIVDLESAILAYPTYAEQSKVFDIVNNLLVGHAVWTKAAPHIKEKIYAQGMKQAGGTNYSINQNYGAIINQNNGNNYTQQQRPSD